DFKESAGFDVDEQPREIDGSDRSPCDGHLRRGPLDPRGRPAHGSGRRPPAPDGRLWTATVTAG
ncbi:hypothetical protein ACFU7B_31965, partial [Streptomyces sp. NPDC057545]